MTLCGDTMNEPASSESHTDRWLWQIIRRALLMVVRAIERRFGK